MRVFLRVSFGWNPSRREGPGDAFAGSLDCPFRFGRRNYPQDSDNSCHANRGMLAACTACKLKDHKNVFAKRQDNALTASEFLSATGSVSRGDLVVLLHSPEHAATLRGILPTVNLTAC